MLREFTLCEILAALVTWWRSREILAKVKDNVHRQQNTPEELKSSGVRRVRPIARGEAAEQLHAGDVRSSMQLRRMILRQQMNLLKNKLLIGVVGNDGLMVYGRGRIRRMRR